MNIRHKDGFSGARDTCVNGHSLNLTTGENVKLTSQGPKCLTCYTNARQDYVNKRTQQRKEKKERREALAKLSESEREVLERTADESEELFNSDLAKIPLPERIRTLESGIENMAKDIKDTKRMPRDVVRDIQSALREDREELRELKEFERMQKLQEVEIVRLTPEEIQKLKETRCPPTTSRKK